MMIHITKASKTCLWDLLITKYC